MGSLTLPSSGTVYVDANAVIYGVERIEPYNNLLLPLWRGAQAGNYSIVSSDLLLLETLVKPIREDNVVLEASFRTLLLASNEIRLTPITIPILEHAARLRATTKLKTPDAIHAATALALGCNLFVTNDRDLARVPELPVAVLSDIVLLS
ncbi:MAG: PIN domain-containing protein [Chloroflexota bacterium]|nr:PIN domain-containing protein [Chloroflexota bacterium]